MLYDHDTQQNEAPHEAKKFFADVSAIPVAPPAIKKMMIVSVLELLGNPSLQDKKIILLTPTGIVKGRIYIQKESGQDFDSPLWALTQAVSRSYEQYCPDAPLPGNDGFLLLQDVTIEQAQNTTQLESMIVFFDQIIAVSMESL